MSTLAGDRPPPIVARLEALAGRERTPCGPGSMIWRTWGRGRPVVLLHGGSGSWTHWIRNVPVLAEGRRVLAPDLPGCGDSDMPPAPHTAEHVADIVAAGLAHLASAPLDLVGFSFGGIVAGLVAARLGGQVGTLVLVGPNGLAARHGPLPALRPVRPALGPDQARAAHRENLARLMIADPARVDDLAVALHAENVRRARFRIGGIPDSDVLLRALPAVTARLAGLWGGRDAFAVPYLEDRRRLLAAFQPDLDFRVIEGAGHWVIYEAADEANLALREML